MQIAIFIVIIQLILWLGHFLLYKTIIKFLLPGATLLWWLRAAIFLLSVSFVSATLFAFRFDGPLVRFFYRAAAVWLGTFYFLLGACALVWLTYVFSAFKISPGAMRAAAAAVFAAALLLSAYGVWNSYRTRVSRYQIALKNLPAQWKGRKIVMVSDTHFGPFRGIGFANKISRLIAAQQPDLVLIPGDFYDGGPADFYGLARPFGQIKSAFGVYFSSGNHEEFVENMPYLQAIRAAGINILNDKKVEVDGLQIAGVDFAGSRKLEDAEKLYASLQIDPGRASILLKHEPNNIPAAEKAGISLQLSGHTHNGQIWPLGLLAKRLYGEYYLGYHRLGNFQIITSSGAGTWGPPQRVGTSPEIIVITLM